MTTMMDNVRARKLPFLILLLLCSSSVYAGKCEQNSTDVVCTRRSSVNPLLSIYTRDLSRLETIVVHNAQMDLTEDLVQIDDNLPNVSLMNLTGNSIERIGRRGFDKVHNLQFLYLSDNVIHQSLPNPFMSLSRLQLVEMNKALGGTANDKSKLLENLFKSDHQFVHLSDIHLNDNGIDHLNPKTFCYVKGLRRIELANNRLKNFDFAKACFTDLKALMLSGNLIEQIPDDIWDWMPSLTTLDISNNPIHCGCSISEIVKSEDISFINQGNTFCASPAHLKGKNVFDLPKDFCKHDGGRRTLRSFIILSIIAAALMYAYKKYRDRLSMISTPVGYMNIKDEQATQPVFV